MLQRNTWKDIDDKRHRFQPVLNDALELLKEQQAEIDRLKGEKEKAIRDIDLYIADLKEDEGATYFRGTIYGLTIAKEILQGIRNHG